MTLRKLSGCIITTVALVVAAFAAQAQWHAPDIQEPSSPEDMTNALTGGVPGGR